MPKRMILNLDLQPVAGSRFQPTGFPDLGAGTFDKPVGGSWVKALLVESEQSMANHLEATGWDRGTQQPVVEFKGLPYVRVVNATGEYLTSSRTEAHRLSSAFIRESKLGPVPMIDALATRLDLKVDVPHSARTIAAAVFALDPLCLVHGVFFADPKLVGQPKITRAITSFVEAIDVRPAEYGGVKRDDVRHKNAEDGGSGEGYGSIPFHRTQYTAQRIVLSMVLDLDQLRSYGLSADATRLLEVVAMWEMRTLFDGGLRLRTACDLAVTEGAVVALPTSAELASELVNLADKLSQDLNGGKPLEVVWSGGSKKPAKAAATDAGDSDTGS